MYKGHKFGRLVEIDRVLPFLNLFISKKKKTRVVTNRMLLYPCTSFIKRLRKGIKETLE